MLIFLVIFTLMSGILMSLFTSHTRLMEHYIRRTKGYYAAEAGSVAAYESMRLGGGPYDQQVDWFYDLNGNPVSQKFVSVYDVGTGIGGSTEINSDFDYTLNW
jgi:hypothetical protein